MILFFINMRVLIILGGPPVIRRSVEPKLFFLYFFMVDIPKGNNFKYTGWSRKVVIHMKVSFFSILHFEIYKEN